jgi:acetyl-CoA carboxylase biotin carboxyl carrier protein
MKFTNQDVQEILQLLDATKYDELHLETERFKLKLCRNPNTGDWTQESKVLSAPSFVQPSPVSSVTASASAAVVANPPDPRKAGWAEVRAHLPGTFYRAPKPGAPPFVELGSRVEKDTVVGIIETMKLMNAVYSQTRGEVVEISSENAQFVEKAAVLMRIKPSAA